MKKEDVKVSVLCTAYNHEKFLRKCLDGFVMQKTNFKFEVIVHDDASTDGTKTIIEEYVKKYPNIFVPIYQTENQYSKKVCILDDIMYPITKGKYIAICEGDDYWCDENKLQIQYDFMELNRDCSACFHNTLMNNTLTKINSYENNWTDLHIIEPEEIFKMGFIHTSSYFVRREIFRSPDYGKYVWTGDFIKKTYYYTFGKLAVLPQVMSVYNINDGSGSLTNNFFRLSDEKTFISRIDDIINYLKIYDEKNVFKYTFLINQLILNLEFIKIININLKIMTRAQTRKDFYSARKQIKSHKGYKFYLKRFKGLLLIKKIIKFNIPFFMWKVLKRNKHDEIIWVE